MQQLKQSIKNVFGHLNDSLHQLSDEQYNRPSKHLFNATIGQHVRHIIELFISLQAGYRTGIINYEKRDRDLRIQTDREFARQWLIKIYQNMDVPDKALMLEANYDEHSGESFFIPTNYQREALYNLEHTIHHMALIRVGINEVSTLQVPQEFGVAASTIKHQNACAR
jgi:hypothetical protein